MKISLLVIVVVILIFNIGFIFGLLWTSNNRKFK